MGKGVVKREEYKRMKIEKVKNKTIYMVEPKLNLHSQVKTKGISTIIVGDYNSRAFKSQSLNYTKKWLPFLPKIFSYIFLII